MAADEAEESFVFRNNKLVGRIEGLEFVHEVPSKANFVEMVLYFAEAGLRDFSSVAEHSVLIILLEIRVDSSV